MTQTGSLKFTDPKRRDLPICETPISREVDRTRKERESMCLVVCVSDCLRMFTRNIQIAFILDGWKHAGSGG